MVGRRLRDVNAQVLLSQQRSSRAGQRKLPRMPRVVLFPLLFLLCVRPSPSLAAPACLPADEAIQQPDFFSFRAHLQAAVARRDVAAVLAVVDPAIKNSFGGDDGIDGFRRLWRPEAADSGLWAALGAVLALGGRFQGPDGFVAPYVFTCEVPDAFTTVVVIGTGVAVRASPSRGAAVADRVDYVVLTVADRAWDTDGWVKVRLDGGREGFVSAAYARAPIDHRAYFQRKGGRWRLVTFVSGD